MGAEEELLTYCAAGCLVVAALAVDLEGNIVGGVALDLDGAGGQVVEVLAEQLEKKGGQRWATGVEKGSEGGLDKKCRSGRALIQVSPELVIVLTSLAALEISWKAGTDIVTDCEVVGWG